MKTVIKLLIAAAFLNAAARCSMVAWDYYQFKDATEQIIRFGAAMSPAQLQSEIKLKADEIGIPIGAADIVIRRDGPRTYAEAFYIQPVEYFPGQEYPVEMSFEVEALAVKVPTPDDVLQ